ncbi:hypothetical protein ACH5RR_019700 [Cinchona calisaya]|uniref:Uncharacterized protein n=1 Tax=Cinchona calisaya TaxID=153742 RepID=A0ABD2ZQ49_9GENT
MKIRIFRGIKQMFTRNGNGIENPTHLELDLREEYANAFRTESYNEFWERVLGLGKPNSVTHTAVGSTTAARLPSYRLFAEHLLDPDQPTVARILALTQTHPETQAILSDYFLETANASFLCSNLLRDVDHTRIKYKSLKTTLDSFPIVQVSPINYLPVLPIRLLKYSNFGNPFLPSAQSPKRIQEIQINCSDLIKRVELSRDKTRAKFKLLTKLKHGSAVFLVVLTASLTIIIAAHALALLVATPCVIATSFELVSSKKLARWSAQLDAAAKGTYILTRDLDTISRLVSRLSDELDHMHATVRFWQERGDDRLQAGGEVARQLKMNNMSFTDQLDELEERLYLCFMTINRARDLVLKEIHDPGHPTSTSLTNL